MKIYAFSLCVISYQSVDHLRPQTRTYFPLMELDKDEKKEESGIYRIVDKQPRLKTLY